jgi:serine/threonine protein kinase
MSAGYRPSVVSLVGATLDGRYQVLEILGEGGMGAVYKAVTPENQHVAVKVLHEELGDNEELRERFEREARALFRLEHPHILAAHDFGVVDGSPYLVMELLRGLPLDKYIEETPPDPPTALAIARQILTGLAFAHSHAALHRDLKSENVFIQVNADGTRVAKLLDFGLVKFTDDNKWGAAKKLTVQGSVFGTPAYMAPEQCIGAATDARSDVYAIGVIIFELLTGEWPFMEETQMAMFQAHLVKPAPTLVATRPDLRFRPELEELVAKALAKNPDHRFQDAQSMLAALDAIPHPAATSATIPMAPTPSSAPAAAPKRSVLPIFIGAGLVGLVALGLLVFVLTR